MTAAPILIALLVALDAPSNPSAYFKILVVDEATGRGVPLVELSTVNDIRYYTDSNGVVAFHEPGLMDKTVFFHVAGHGYEFPKDGFGYRGKQLKPTAGGEAVLEIKRINVAERLYRVTGAGIYRDSLLAGHPVPIEQPVLNGLVFGSDSVVNAAYRGKLYWFWGDTNRPAYPLGNFHVPGATSMLPSDGGLDPEVGVNLNYFVDENGFAKPTCKMPGEGPTWIDAVVPLDGESGAERLFAHYVKVAKPMRIYEQGLVEFNDEKKEFEKRTEFDLDAPLIPSGHPLKHRVGDVDYVYFVKPYPLVRVRATPAALVDLSQYEAYTCFRQGSRQDRLELERDHRGKLRYDWKKDTLPLTGQLQQKLVADGQMKLEEGMFPLRDIETGKAINVHGGSVYFNAYRRRWVMIALESFGTSLLGEIWYAQSDQLVGPWVYARKIVTHDKYSFYNPKQHPMFDKLDGRIIFFEGTYTNTFSGNPDRTPRYNYNQVMYKLDLADPRLVLPVPVYRLSTDDSNDRLATQAGMDVAQETAEVAFCALDRPGKGVVPVFAEEAHGRGHRLTVGPITGGTFDLSALEPFDLSAQGSQPLFYALPAAMDEPPPITVPLYEFVHEDGNRRKYSTDEQPAYFGYRRGSPPICRVWKAR